jgi:hypothetical protein
VFNCKIIWKKQLQEKVEATKQKEERGKKPRFPLQDNITQSNVHIIETA